MGFKQGIFVGNKFETNNGGPCEVIKYDAWDKITIKFADTGSEVVTSSGSLRKGWIRDPYRSTVSGVGFQGKISKKDISYSAWSHMLARCYKKCNKLYPRYGGRGITVCKEWHNLEHYSKWYHANYQHDFAVDKDLRVPYSKVYSPNTCEFIPQRVNNLLVFSNKSRGRYPVGVSPWRRTGDYKAQYSRGGLMKHIGLYSTPELAFDAYKIAKEEYIKKVATEEYNAGNISEQVYNSLMKWEIIPFPD